MTMSDELTTGQQNAVAQLVRAHEMEIARLQADLRTRESLRAEYLARAERAEALLAASREQTAAAERELGTRRALDLSWEREKAAREAAEREVTKLREALRDTDDNVEAIAKAWTDRVFGTSVDEGWDAAPEREKNNVRKDVRDLLTVLRNRAASPTTPAGEVPPAAVVIDEAEWDGCRACDDRGFLLGGDNVLYPCRACQAAPIEAPGKGCPECGRVGGNNDCCIREGLAAAPHHPDVGGGVAVDMYNCPVCGRPLECYESISNDDGSLLTRYRCDCDVKAAHEAGRREGIEAAAKWLEGWFDSMPAQALPRAMRGVLIPTPPPQAAEASCDCDGRPLRMPACPVHGRIQSAPPAVPAGEGTPKHGCVPMCAACWVAAGEGRVPQGTCGVYWSVEVDGITHTITCGRPLPCERHGASLASEGKGG
jgi:hypothetical protein